jgi:F0F1-type ATP synthase assembly protein I
MSNKRIILIALLLIVAAICLLLDWNSVEAISIVGGMLALAILLAVSGAFLTKRALPMVTLLGEGSEDDQTPPTEILTDKNGKGTTDE